jgi:hypothetical protein
MPMFFPKGVDIAELGPVSRATEAMYVSSSQHSMKLVKSSIPTASALGDTSHMFQKWIWTWWLLSVN